MTDPGFAVHRDEVLEEAAQEITRVARGHLAKNKGHMTWAECVVLLRKMKTTQAKETPTHATEDQAPLDTDEETAGDVRAQPDG